MSSIRLVEGGVEIVDFTVRDPVLAELIGLQATPEAAEAVLERVLVTGARGIASMGVGLDLAELDDRVKRGVSSALARFEETISAGMGLLADQLDPKQRSSLVAQALGELSSLQAGFLAGVDPDRTDSHAGILLARLNQVVGPGGPVAKRLEEALDPTAAGSALSRGFSSIKAEVGALRDFINQEKGRSEEAVRGTAKGVDFEHRVDHALREAARPLGAIVEHTGRASGDLGASSVVGDYLVTLQNGSRIAVEVKNQATIGLTGKQGVLEELDRACANRSAEAAMCISAGFAYPQEVGPFGVFRNRVLVVDDGEGTLIWTGLRWLSALLSAPPQVESIDLAAVADRLHRLRTICQKFVSQRSALTEINKSVERVSDSLGGIREEVLGLIEDLTREVRLSGPGRPPSQGEVVTIPHRQAG
jgi:hypothetical protein